MGERVCASQLAQLACTMPAGGKNVVPAKKGGHRPTKWSVDHTKCRLAITNGRWQEDTAGEKWGWPTSHSLPSKAKTQVFGTKPNIE